MAKLSVTTSQTLEIKLAPRVKAQLRVQLSTYAELNAEMKALKTKMQGIKDYAEKVFMDADAADALLDGTNVDGFKVKMVQGKSTTVDKVKVRKKLIALGADEDWFDEEGCVTKDKAAYVKITPPGEKDDE